MALARKLEDRLYTWGDIEKFPDAERWELIDGIPYQLADPSGTHIHITKRFTYFFEGYLQDKTCTLMPGFPIWPDGKPKHKNQKGRLVPDLLVYCDPSIYTDLGLIGTPDLVVEVLSPSTAKKDKVYKFHKYLQLGVREYWIVSPDFRSVDVHILKDGEYHVIPYGDTDTVTYGELAIDLSQVFPPLPLEEEVDDVDPE